MNIGCAFVTNFQATIAIEPTMCSLHHPTMTPQLLRRLDTLARNPRRDAASSQRAPLVSRVVGFIGVQLLGAFTRATHGALDGADGINSFFHHSDVMHVGCAQRDGERDAFGFDHKMRMPRSTSRFGMRGLPPFAFSGSGGSNGSMTSHSSSVINGCAMPHSLHGKLGFC